ncbi:MAG: T9SS type A sorting domain-containing protein [Ignavibacteriales bacterium]|nr:T9SS type A sorting domain-containing protein [Ignavibacteriales bacterium]
MRSRSLFWITFLGAIAFLLPAVTLAQLTGTYTIGTGNTYTTLKAAIDALNSDGASGVVTFLVNQDMTVNADSISQAGLDGTTASLVIKPAPGKTPTVTFRKCATYAAAAPNSGAGLAIDGITQAMSNITIDGSNTANGTTRDMTFKLSDTTSGRYCILVNGHADNVTIKNLNITVDSIQIDNTAPGYTFETAGIAVTGSATSTGKVADNLTITNCNIYGNSTRSQFKNGMYIVNVAGGATYSGGVKVTNNVVNVSTVGIYLVRAAKTGAKSEISGNTVSLNSIYSAGYTHYGIELENWQDTVNIFNNKCVTLKAANTYTAGLTLNGLRTYIGQTGSVVNIYNNFFSDFQLSGARTDGYIYGINVNHSSSTGNAAVHNIYHNTVFLNSSYGNTTGRFATFRLSNNTVNATVVNLKNNLLVNTIKNALSYGIDCLKPAELVTSDYNDIFADTVGNYASTNWTAVKAALADWKTATGQDAHSISVNPANPFGAARQLTSITNPHWFSAPTNIFAGTPITGITKDIDGDTRSLTVPYMGADEAGPFTAVAKQTGATPLVFGLEQNYPNPFNPSTTIAFSVAAKSDVSLTVFDMVGREVAELVRQELPAGEYRQQFNANGLASGLYLYRLTAVSKEGHANLFTDVKKLLLVK